MEYREEGSDERHSNIPVLHHSFMDPTLSFGDPCRIHKGTLPRDGLGTNRRPNHYLGASRAGGGGVSRSRPWLGSISLG